MKIQFVSDLHLEFNENRLYLAKNPLPIVGDVLLIAGDTAYLDKPESGENSYCQYGFWDWATTLPIRVSTTGFTVIRTATSTPRLATRLSSPISWDTYPTGSICGTGSSPGDG